MFRMAARIALLSSLFAGSVHAQQRQCDINAPGRTENAGAQLIILHDPFTVLCDDGAELRATSGRLNQASRELHLVGNVFFEDADRRLTADEATYNSLAGRLWATGNVVFVNEAERSTLRGPELEYFRAGDERPVAEVLATRRPTITMEPAADSEDGEPLNLVADRVLILGEDDLSAFGSVVITRADLEATSEEAQYNSTSEDLELRQNARIRNDEYNLTGEVIQARMADGSLEHVHSRTDATLEGEEMFVSAPDLQLFFAADSLQRAVAVVPDSENRGRALARSRNFELQADSIDAAFTDQQIREVYAVGHARAETQDTTAVHAQVAAPADSASLPQGSPGPDLPPILATDWVLGDTVIGYFEPVTPAASVDSLVIGEPVEREGPENRVDLRRLIAIGSAQSLYRMTPEDQIDGARKNVNFLVGQRIELELLEGELAVATVTGLERGVYLEATAPPLPAAADSASSSGEPVPPLPTDLPGVG